MRFAPWQPICGLARRSTYPILSCRRCCHSIFSQNKRRELTPRCRLLSKCQFVEAFIRSLSMAKSNARVPLVERETVPAADLPAYDHVAKSRGAGRMPNVFKALANNPAVMERVAAVGEYMRFQSKIDPQ